MDWAVQAEIDRSQSLGADYAESDIHVDQERRVKRESSGTKSLRGGVGRDGFRLAFRTLKQADFEQVFS